VLKQVHAEVMLHVTCAAALAEWLRAFAAATFTASARAAARRCGFAPAASDGGVGVTLADVTAGVPEAWLRQKSCQGFSRSSGARGAGVA
jgi:uncharacterized protein YfiM (DUF2279 family)